MHLLGIDIGGTKTLVALGDETGALRASERMPTQSSDSMDTYFGRLFELCERVLAGTSTDIKDVDAIGISAPGPLNTKKGILITPPNNPGWRDVPVVQRISERFDRPVCFDNDANAAVLAEYLFGDYKGTSNMVYLTCSTGMGGGIIANGCLVQGVNDMGGEVGHMKLSLKGPKCGCGQEGCFEAYCGGRNFAERTKKAINDEAVDTLIVKLAGSVDAVTAVHIARGAREGDAFAVEVWHEFIDRLAQGIANVIQVLNPKIILLGTIAIKEGPFLMDPLMERLKKYAWDWPLSVCTIMPNTLVDRLSPLCGIAVAVEGLRK